MNVFPPISAYDPFADATMAEPASTYDFLHSMSPVDFSRPMIHRFTRCQSMKMCWRP